MLCCSAYASLRTTSNESVPCSDLLILGNGCNLSEPVDVKIYWLSLLYRSESVEAYTYDALGNRTARTLNGIQKASCQYNALNQLTAMSEDGTAYSFVYDKCGNLTEEHREGSLVRQ